MTYVTRTGVQKILSARRPVTDGELTVDLSKFRAWYAEEDEADNTSTESENQEGEAKPVEIDWSKIDPTKIPEDVIKKTPGYKKVLDESVTRRKKLQEVKKTAKPVQREEPVDDDDDGDDVGTNSEIEMLKRQLNALVEVQSKSLRVQAAEKAGLDPTNDVHMQLITGNDLTEMLASAKRVADAFGIKPNAKRNQRNSADSIDANPGNEQEMNAMRKKIRERLDGGVASNPFEPGTQRMIGGGATRINYDD